MQNMIEPWALSKDEVFNMLSSKDDGLSDREAASRLLKYGNNVFHNSEKVSIFKILLKQFISPLIFLLLGAAILTAILYEWVDTIFIIFATLLNVAIGFYHENNAENTLDELTTYIKDRARVIRGGKEVEIDSALLVPGDIIKLSYGTRIPADARIISINNFRVDEAILTGESMPVFKKENVEEISVGLTERKNIAFAGTLVVEGFASAIVYATGNDTEIGKIAKIVSSTERSKTPLQKGVDNLAWFIFVVVIVVVIGIFILGIGRGEAIVPMLILSAAVAVGAVPEALPITVTMILAIGATRIAKKKGIVRKLSAAETLGSTTLIMTDKTGTLTLAEMQLRGIYTKDSIINNEVLDVDKEIHGKISSLQKDLLSFALLNIDVSIENPNDKEVSWTFRGRPFEVNIAMSCREHGVPIDIIPSTSSFLALPFNSTNKFSVAFKDDAYIVMGAPDILLKKSKMSKDDYLRMEQWIEKTSIEGKRIIGIGRFLKTNKDKNITGDDVVDIDFLGMLVFVDPIRPEVKDAISNIEEHGIKVILVTGDLPGTAISVANSLGWNINNEQVLTGVDIRVLSDEELLGVLPKIKIFARVTPEDKLRIGKLFQSLGEVVAMTGDGVNDAPALKAMDIGISLGSGSDVAKSAADLVLLDDNFHTISLAIDEGHRILSNIRKTVVYIMSTSLDEVFVIGGSLLFVLPIPLTALQIIWVNLFTGSLPALAFAYEENLDKKKYTGTNSKMVFTLDIKILTMFVGILSSFFLFLVYYFLLKYNSNIEEVRSIFFVCFSTYVLVVAYSFRSLNKSIFSYNIFSNKKLNYSIILAVFLLFITIVIPQIRSIFDLGPLPISSIPFIILWLIFNISLVEFAKFVLRKKDYIFAFFNKF